MLNSTLSLSILLTISILIFFGIVVVYTFSASRKDKKRRFAVATNLGFKPVTESEYSDVLSHLASVNPRLGKSFMEMRNVFVKIIPEGSLYLYDLWNNGGEGSNLVQNQSILLAIPGINLPRFMISSKANMAELPGVLANLANRLIAWVFQNSLIIIDFPEFPEFNQRYTVATEDPVAMRKFLDSYVASRLSLPRDLLLAGGNDSLVCSSASIQRHNSPEDADLSRRIDNALSTMRIFIQNVERQSKIDEG